MDYSEEVQLASTRGTRLAFLGLGHACVALGVIGLFLPVMPTTVFLLAGAACYARASARFYNRLLNNRIFGPVIVDWRHHRAMTLKAKTIAITFIAVTIGATIGFAAKALWLRLLLAGIALGVVTFLVRIRRRR